MTALNATQKFTRVLVRVNNGFAVIESMRHMAEAGLPLASSAAAHRAQLYVDSLARLGQLEKLINGNKDEYDLHQRAKALRDTQAAQTVRHASRAVDAASLVFGHTVLDDAVTSYLEITCDVAFDFWRHRVKAKKVELATLQNTSIVDVTRKAIKEDFWAVSRESLPKRADLMHAVCTDFGTMDSYKYDRATIVRIDKARQDVIHGELLGKEIDRIQDDLSYLRRTWDYFFMAMQRSFDLSIDLAEIGRGSPPGGG